MTADPVQHRAVVTVDDAAPGTSINPRMWGVFFEDLNWAADGGLYAELVRNRDFAFTERDSPGWGPLTGWLTEGDVLVEEGAGTSVRLDGSQAPARLVNEGFDGIPVSAGAGYRAQVEVTAVEGSPSVELHLTSAEGVVLASTALPLPSDDGDGDGDGEPVLLTGSLTASADDDAARLRLSVDGGAVSVRWVSLFPRETFRGAENGLRADLAEAVAELRPQFVRFPGGCLAHGLGLENTYRWPASVGPVRERRGDSNIWGYHQTLGLGYYEYFLFCEQIGAEPLPVVAAGVCCQNSPGGQAGFSGEEMAAYVREVLDLVEFANGPVESRWGSVRAAAGHPEPFGLTYLGIGNEDEQTPLFADRFTTLFEAVRAAHPEVVVIGTVGPLPFGEEYERGWATARELGVPLVDEHSYKSARWFFQNLDRYDGYDRSGPGVYLGEYGSWSNTMLSALAEAAAMMAMERNGDVVRLASFAPLLARTGRTQWVPDLIYFDGRRVHRTLNYCVQQMHACSPGTRSLPVRVEGAPQWERRRSAVVGLGVEARSGTLVVEQAALRHAGGTTTVPGCSVTGALHLPVEVVADDYAVQLSARLEGGHDGFTVSFGDHDSDLYHRWHLGTWQERQLALKRVVDGREDEWAEAVPHRFDWSRTYDLEITVQGRGRSVTCRLDGEVVFEQHDDERPEQRFSATSVVDDRTGTTWVKVVNATPDPVDVVVGLGSGRAVQGLVVTSLTAPADAGEPFCEAPASPERHRVDGATWTAQPFTFATLDVRPE